MFSYGDKLYTSFSGGSDSFLGISIYGKNDTAWWHKVIIVPIWRVGKKINDFLWQFKYRFVKAHRYNIIETDLEPGYYDIDTVMLHGMFALLTRYVDHEHDGVVDLERWGEELCFKSDGMSAHSSHLQGEKELEAVALYRWWHEVRPADHKRCEELLHILYGKRSLLKATEPFDTEKVKLYDEFRALEAKIEDEETEMLHRLIDIRGGLWT